MTDWTKNDVYDLIRMGRDYQRIKYPVPVRVTLPDNRVIYCQQWESLEVPIGILDLLREQRR